MVEGEESCFPEKSKENLFLRILNAEVLRKTAPVHSLLLHFSKSSDRYLCAGAGKKVGFPHLGFIESLSLFFFFFFTNGF